MIALAYFTIILMSFIYFIIELEEMKEIFKDKKNIAIGILVLLIFFLGVITALIFTENSALKLKETQALEKIKELEDNFKRVGKERDVAKENAIKYENDAKIAIAFADSLLKNNKIKKDGIKKEVININNLSPDSTYKLFTKLAEEYISTNP